jgi:hypothetical protein
VDQQWQNRAAIVGLAPVLILFGADFTEHDGIDNFQM